jgi:TetR/AcrR family transcriptional repressor of mexJK operon
MALGARSMKLAHDEIEEHIETLPIEEGEPRRGRGRPKVRSDEAQRTLIVHSALALFVRHGYAATTMNDIAAECHVSKRTLYRLFPGKTDLFAGMVEAHRHMMLSFPEHDPTKPIEEQLEKVFLIDIDPELERQRIGFIQLAIIEARQSPELGAIVRSHGADRTKAQLTTWLAKANELGMIKVADPTAAASIVMDMMFGAVALKTGTGAEWPDHGDRKAYMRQCIRYFVNGIKSG